jgi:pyruvate formate lyase activating enzyme
MLIAGFQPFTLSDYPGKPAAIVFTPGCNFRCPFCHNRSLWPQTVSGPPVYTTAEILQHAADRRDLVTGLVITGGEPTLQSALAEFLAEVKKNRGLRKTGHQRQPTGCHRGFAGKLPGRLYCHGHQGPAG